jgi:hypothetical protein
MGVGDGSIWGLHTLVDPEALIYVLLRLKSLPDWQDSTFTSGS